jgi:predicted permease
MDGGDMLSELWSDLRYRVRALVQRDAVEHELDAELQFHIEKEAEKYERSGLSRAESLRRARIAFGGVERVKEESRDRRGTRWLERRRQDIRYSLRSLRHQPTFAAGVVLTLAIGIGANTTVFTLVDALLLRPLPVPHAEQLVTIGDPHKVHSGWHGSPMVDYVSYPVFANVRDANRVLSGLYATGDAGVAITMPGGSAAEAEHPNARFASGDFFSVLEIPAFVGRTFGASDDDAGRPGVAVISYGYWQRRFGGARSVLGATLLIGGIPVTIVGITPPGFTGDIVGENTDLWLPIALQPALDPRDDRLTNRGASWLLMMGRLAPGVSLEQARAALTAIELRDIRAHLSGLALTEFDHDVETDPIHVERGALGFSAHRGTYEPALLVLMAAVGVVVLVVCANVSNLMLSRAAARVREMTVRMTLGAGRARLVAQLMTESAILAILSGVLGLLATRWATQAVIAAVAVGGAPVVIDARPDWRVLAFTAGIVLLCVGGVGVLPALRATRVDLATALRGQGRSLLGARTRLGKGLVVAQIALSMTLLVAVGLLVRSARELLRADLGLDRDRLLVAHVAAGRGQYLGARLQAFRTQMAEAAARVPGVLSAAYTQEGIFSGGESLGHVDIPGVVARSDSQAAVNFDRVGPGYFRVLGATLLRGRDFEPRDAEPGMNVAIVDQTMAKAYFPHADALGRSLRLEDTSYTIVGVVRDVEEEDVRGSPVRRVYLSQPEPEARPLSFELVVRVEAEPVRYVAALRQALSAAAGNIPVSVAPLDDRIRQSLSQDLLLMRVTAFFGVVALLLAAIGLYGVTAYAGSQRVGEFGLRIALGAEPGAVARIVAREALGIAALGVSLGVPAGIAAAQLIRAQTFGVATIDPPSLVVAVIVLMATALAASVAPALRAARVTPVEALRSD